MKFLRELQRMLYLESRTIGDVRAASRGPVPLAKRIIKRRYHREAINLLRKGGLW